MAAVAVSLVSSGVASVCVHDALEVWMHLENFVHGVDRVDARVAPERKFSAEQAVRGTAVYGVLTQRQPKIYLIFRS